MKGNQLVNSKLVNEKLMRSLIPIYRVTIACYTLGYSAVVHPITFILKLMKPLTMTLHWLNYFSILTAYSLIRKRIAIGQILLARTELFELINAYVIKDL